jgi:hypothetical protein
MIKSTLVIAVVAVLALGTSTAQTVQNFIIDPDPTLGQTEGAALEKVVDYFTSTTNLSVVNANGQGPGGVFLYTNDGSLTGNWTKYQIGYGDCYEHAEAFKYPGLVYPGVIASCDNQLIWFANPANWGGDPTQLWSPNTIYDGSGCHNFALADIDGDGKQDVVCSSAVALSDGENFIVYQNNYDDWTYVAGPGQIGGDVTLISVGGSPRNNVVGSAIDGSGVYWFKYPGSRNGIWASHYIGSANAGVSIGSGTLPNGQDYVVVASAEQVPVAWPRGLGFFTQKSDPTQPWNAMTIDSTFRAVHQLTVGTFENAPYILAAEEEQACINVNDSYHEGIPCRVEILQYQNGAFNPTILLTDQGTQNQSVIPYQGGLLIVGANHGNFGGYPALQGWIVGTSGSPSSLPPGTYSILGVSGKVVDGGFGYWGDTPRVQLYQIYPGNTFQQWTFRGDGSLLNGGVMNIMRDPGNGTVDEQSFGDVWTILQSGSGYAIQDTRTRNFLVDNGGTLGMGANGARAVWSIGAPK